MSSVEKEMGDHGKSPSYRESNESILPGLSGCRISRKLEVQDPMRRPMAGPRWPARALTCRILTVCFDATSLVVGSYGCDDGKIGPTRCAVIGAGRGDR